MVKVSFEIVIIMKSTTFEGAKRTHLTRFIKGLWGSFEMLGMFCPSKDIQVCFRTKRMASEGLTFISFAHWIDSFLIVPELKTGYTELMRCK